HLAGRFIGRGHRAALWAPLVVPQLVAGHLRATAFVAADDVSHREAFPLLLQQRLPLDPLARRGANESFLPDRNHCAGAVVYELGQPRWEPSRISPPLEVDVDGVIIVHAADPLHARDGWRRLAVDLASQAGQTKRDGQGRRSNPDVVTK